LAFDRFDGHGKRKRKQPAEDTTTRLRLNVAPALGYLGAVPQRATGRRRFGVITYSRRKLPRQTTTGTWPEPGRGHNRDVATTGTWPQPGRGHNRDVATTGTWSEQIPLGAGVGDHTRFYLDRGSSVLATDARPGNLALLRRRLSEHPAFGRLEMAVVDVDQPFPAPGLFDVVHCYGLLYHLANPVAAIAAIVASCAELFFLESKTDPGEQEVSSAGDENRAEVFHSYSGRNFRPTRAWIARNSGAIFPMSISRSPVPPMRNFRRIGANRRRCLMAGPGRRSSRAGDRSGPCSWPIARRWS
jgi:SAM-dependent methyltransferase